MTQLYISTLNIDDVLKIGEYYYPFDDNELVELNPLNPPALDHLTNYLATSVNQKVASDYKDFLIRNTALILLTKPLVALKRQCEFRVITIQDLPIYMDVLTKVTPTNTPKQKACHSTHRKQCLTHHSLSHAHVKHHKCDRAKINVEDSNLPFNKRNRLSNKLKSEADTSSKAWDSSYQKGDRSWKTQSKQKHQWKLPK